MYYILCMHLCVAHKIKLSLILGGARNVSTRYTFYLKAVRIELLEQFVSDGLQLIIIFVISYFHCQVVYQPYFLCVKKKITLNPFCS